jgi:monoamine oxidase
MQAAARYKQAVTSFPPQRKDPLGVRLPAATTSAARTTTPASPPAPAASAAAPAAVAVAGPGAFAGDHVDKTGSGALFKGEPLPRASNNAPAGGVSLLALRCAASTARSRTHAFDARGDNASRAFATTLLGPNAAAVLGVFDAKASAGHRAAFAAEGLPLAGVLGAVADGVFGRKAGQPVTFAAFTNTLAAAGLSRLIDPLLRSLPRETLVALRAGTTSPRALFAGYAESLASAWSSQQPIAFADLSALLARENRADALPRALRLMTPAQAEALRAGSLTAAQAKLLIDDALSREVDCFIGGAGGAGTRAANDLLDAGMRVVVAEARDRVGGRAYTETDSFGFAFDQGCAYLHHPDLNPMTPIVRSLGLTEIDVAVEDANFKRGKRIDDDGYATKSALEFINLAKAAAEKGRDISVAELVKDRPDLMQAVLGITTNTFGADPDKVSVMDVATKAREVFAGDPTYTPDKFIKEGLGTVVSAMLYGVPVKTSTPITHVKRCDDGYEITAGGQTYFAKKVLLTLPPHVLSKTVTFDPPLPEWKQQALQDLPMGNFKKVVVQVGEEALKDVPLPLTGRDAEDMRIEYVLGVLGRSDTVFAMTGGELSTDYRDRGKDAAVKDVCQRLTKMLGKKIDADKVRAFVSTWDTDPWSQGSYSVARPGSFGSRELGRKPVGEGLFFAGEAYDTPGEGDNGMSWQTYLPGAWRTGGKAAQEILTALQKR